MKYCLIYVTTADMKEAYKIGRALLQKRLAACVNIVPRIKSLYWWEGKICEDEETLIFIKTTTRNTGEVINLIKSLHSYQLPAISSFEISDGNPDFLKWISTEVTDNR